jgi:hypothetical protein
MANGTAALYSMFVRFCEDMRIRRATVISIPP